MVRLEPGAPDLVIAPEDAEPFSIPAAGLRIEPALGRTDRRMWIDATRCVEFPAGAEFSEFEKLISPARGAGHWIGGIERNRGAILGAIGIIVLATFLAIRIVLPAAADSIVGKLPPEAMQTVGKQALTALDGTLFDPSELPADRQEEIVSGFARLAKKAGEETAYQIEFRSSKIGPNAFALPHGVIIVTDEMVEFVGSDEELYGVLAHEIGHIAHRHGMRLVVQKSGLVLMVGFFLGDVSSIFNAAGALPLVLVDSRYSRGFETEADAYAVKFARRSGLGTEPIARLFERFQTELGEDPLPWISSHPLSEDRVRAVRQE